MSDEQIREAIIKAAIRNLNEFGYVGVTKENLFTEYVLRKFFEGMLKDDDNTGRGGAFERVRLALVEECEIHDKALSGRAAAGEGGEGT